jgi:glyoxylase I family protein
VFDVCEQSENAGERFDPWANWIDCSGVERSEIRKVAGQLGAAFDFVDPDGIQTEFTHVNLG